MRPVRLEIEGFTALKEKQVIDFTDIDLFAIAGPTGAGKTSVLDAMQWVLFGRVPRLSQNLSELISLGKDTARVVLDFELRGQRYQVSRAMKRAGNSQAQLDMTGASSKNLASGIQAVNGEVVRLLGLRAESFAMAVVLPQGKFARYFEAAPAERRTLMREIYGLEIFETMRGRAASRAAALGTDVEVLQKQIADVGVSPEQLQEVEDELARVQEGQAERQAKRDAAQERARELDQVLKWQNEWRQAEQKREALQGRQAVHESNVAVVGAAKRAESILVPLERFEAARNSADTSQEQLARARADLDVLGQKLQVATENLEVARARESDIAVLETKLSGLRQVQEKSEEVAAKWKELQQVEADLVELQARRNKHAQEEEVRRSEREGYLERLDEIERAITQLAPQRARAEVLAVLEPSAMLWRQKSGDLKVSRERLEKLEGDFAAARVSLEEWGAKRLAVVEEFRVKEEEVFGARTAVEQVRQANLALSLRAHLHVGQACPVCEQPVDRLPEGRVAELTPVEQSLKDAEVARDRVLRSKASIEGAIQSVENKIAELTDGRDAVAEMISRIELEISVNCSRFLEEFGKDDSAFEAFEVLRRTVNSSRENYEKQVHQRSLMQERLKAIDERIRELGEELVRTRHQASELESRRAEAVERHNRAKAALPVDVPEDLAAAVSNVEFEIRGIREQAERAVKEESRMRAGMEAQHTTMVSASVMAERDAGVRDELFRQLEDGIRDAGFENILAVRLAQVDPKIRQSLEEEIRSFDMERVRVADEVLRLQTVLNGRATTSQEVEESVVEARRLDQIYQAELVRVGGLESERDQLKKTLERVQLRMSQLAEVQQRHVVMSTLASDLRTDRFQNFVFQDLFKELVAGASLRLLQLSQRYTLEVNEETKFFVVDQDNANEKRAIETLSGGETFLASLALALQLSQQVQDAAGSISLDSLFIDEGFGTLDPETLETVAEAVEALRDSGRMVGIITHIAELTNRLPVRLRVHKSVEGSRIEVERD